MKFVYFKILLVINLIIYLTKPANCKVTQEKKEFIDIINLQKNSNLKKNKEKSLGIFPDDSTKENFNKEKFNFNNIILNLSIIENKIKSFKNKLESK